MCASDVVICVDIIIVIIGKLYFSPFYVHT